MTDEQREWVRSGIGRSTPDSDHRLRPRRRERADGPRLVRRPRVHARGPPRADAGRGARVRRGARLADRPRPHADRARGAPHLHGRARVAPGRGRGRAAGRGLRVPRADRRHGPVPRRPRGGRGARSRELRRGAPRGGRHGGASVARPGPARARPRAPDPQGESTRACPGSTRSRRRPACSEPHLRLLEAVRAANAEHSGRRLPINGAGAAGAALADLGLPPDVARGFALLARTAGLVGHLAEEARNRWACRSIASSTGAREAA